MLCTRVFIRKTIADLNDFIVAELDLLPVDFNLAPLSFQFVATDIALVEDGVVYFTLTEEVGPADTRVAEVEHKRVGVGQRVECVIQREAVFGNKALDVGPHIHKGLAQVDVNSADNMVNKLVQLFHKSFSLFG